LREYGVDFLNALAEEIPEGSGIFHHLFHGCDL
jgi:hypothetical protein